MALLERLNEEIKKKTAPFEEKKVLFHQDCALYHVSHINQNDGNIA
jgi:hypothetical protein